MKVIEDLEQKISFAEAMMEHFDDNMDGRAYRSWKKGRDDLREKLEQEKRRENRRG